MRRLGTFGSGPGQEDRGFLERLRAMVENLLDRARGDRPRQALPLSEYRGQTGPVVPYQERREQLLRYRRRQDSSYALAFVLVLLVLVVGLFYGLTWALGGFSIGRAQPTATVVAKTAPAVVESATPPPQVVLPTPAPGGVSASPGASPVASPAVGASPVPGPGTPSAPPQRTYVVKTGDTPGGIAREHGVSVEALMRANSIGDARTLRVGQDLVIPPPSTPTPAPTATPRP